MLQTERRAYDPITAAKLDEFIAKLTEYKDGKHKFTFIVTDPSGNSFVQNPKAPAADEHCTVSHFLRSKENYLEMGYNVDEASLAAETEKAKNEGAIPVESKKAVSQTKEEQEMIMQKMKAYAQSTDPEITAQSLDFSKPIDE